MTSFVRRLTIRIKLAVFTGGFLALSLLGTLATRSALNEQTADGMQINLAGRQRMLSQRMVKEALAWSVEAEQMERDPRVRALGETVDLFDQTLTALAHGGTTLGGDMKPVTLPAAEDPAAVSALKRGAGLWAGLKSDLDRITDGSSAPDSPEAREALSNLDKQNINLLKVMNEATGAFQDAAEQKKATLSVLLWSVLGCMAALYAIAQWFIGAWIIRPLSVTLEVVESIAEGHLNVDDLETRNNNEISRLRRTLNRMKANLHGTITSIVENTRQLAATSTEVAASAEQMARNSLTQTDQTAQVSTGIEEMTATIIASSKNASETAELARAAADTAQTGEEVVRSTIEGMGHIAESTQNTMSVISGLAGNVQQIGDITEVIDDIADQTNLLALNAAIEAARAGEQGRGFAVVADEVRKLAERTTKATTEITEMITSVTEKSNDAVEAMTAAGVLVDEGRGKADKAGDALREILDVSRKVQDMIGQIATATDEQSASAEEISQNIESINTVTRENSTGAGEAAKAAEDLSRRTGDLEKLVGQFQLK